jgi:hypothetical protein
MEWRLIWKYIHAALLVDVEKKAMRMLSAYAALINCVKSKHAVPIVLRQYSHATLNNRDMF